jgi:hypothetical protein
VIHYNSRQRNLFDRRYCLHDTFLTNPRNFIPGMPLATHGGVARHVLRRFRAAEGAGVQDDGPTELRWWSEWASLVAVLDRAHNILPG